MSVTVQNVLDLISDYTSSETGQADTSQRIRQINTAVSYLQRKLGLPSDEKIHRFYFSDDQFFYSAPTDFMEELDLVYDNPDYNTDERRWDVGSYADLIKKTGIASTRNKWGFTTINGSNQLMLLGDNINAGTVIDDLDTLGTWVASGDASGLEVDELEKKVGDGSLSFDITNSSGTATLTKTGLSLDVETLFENHGYFKLWTYMTSAAIDSVALRLYVDDSNYWTITATALDDGSAFSANAWKKLGWALDNVVETGTPEITEDVTKIAFIFDLGASLTTASNFRVDHLFTAIPDYMNLIYRSSYKGETSSGTDLTTLTDVTDKIAIGEFFPDCDDLIARRAAMNLWPALRADANFYMIYKDELKELIRDFGMRFPRRRANKYLPHRLRRN